MRVRTVVISLGLGLAVLLLWALLSEREAALLEIVDRSEMVFVQSEDPDLPLPYDLKPFWIDRFEVRESEWRGYAEAMGRADRESPIDADRRAEDFPIRHVDYSEAEHFAEWKGKTLPTNAQWEVAMSGPGGSPMPWGTGFLYAANSHEVWELRSFEGRGVTHVGTFAKGRSAAGAYDMVGNVWEWTSSSYDQALRDRRLKTDPDRDRDEPRLKRELAGLRNWPDTYALPVDQYYPASFEELEPLAELDELRLDLWWVLTADDADELTRARGYADPESDQFTLPARVERVSVGEVAPDPLVFAGLDPRLLEVLNDADLELLAVYGESLEDDQYLLASSTPLRFYDREAIARPAFSGSGPEDQLPLWALFFCDVLDFEDRERLAAERRLAVSRLESIDDWRRRFPRFLEARANFRSGERERIVRGGSFLTAIRDRSETLERLEFEGHSAWDLGFRCVVTEEEVERQSEILPLIAELGWRDPLHWLFRVRPARRQLVDLGPLALPYLERARARCQVDWLQARLDSLIDEIRRKE